MIKTKQGKVKNVRKVDYRGANTAMKSYSQGKSFSGLSSTRMEQPQNVDLNTEDLKSRGS